MSASSLPPGPRRTPIDRHNPVGLTIRERECLMHILSGLTVRGAAEKMEVSPKTVEKFRDAINKKLGVHHTMDLVRASIYHDYIDLMSFLKPLQQIKNGPWNKPL